MSRDEHLIDLRPAINATLEKCNDLELFQNNTLRPILKLQNALLINLVRDYFKVHKKNTEAYTFTARRLLVKEVINKDLFLRNSLIYIIVGLFTENEFNFFSGNKKEVSKRILSMATKRVQDQIELVS